MLGIASFRHLPWLPILAAGALAAPGAAAPQIGPPQVAPAPSAPVDERTSAVNAPVAPEAIYVTFAGAAPGVGVLDLNGFGQGTGDPLNSNFLANPNLGAPGVLPPLAPGSSTLDAGGAGPLTFTVDSAGSRRLAGPTELVSAVDLQIGQPLDIVYNNAGINVFASGSQHVNPATGVLSVGNTISVAPHPNPPRLVFPAPNPWRFIGGEEPSTTTSNGPYPFLSTSTPPCNATPANLLVPPLGALFPRVFVGPQPPPPSPPPPPPYCPFVVRQQVGHYLYALDAAAQSVAVLNSNRFTVLARIGVAGADTMAMAPNLKLLAVTGTQVSHVVFIDVDPLSPGFHTVVDRTFVGIGAKKLAWQPEGEDLLVTRRQARELLLIGGADRALRRTLTGPAVTDPIDVVATARQVRFGYQTGTWFAYVLNADGRVAVFESGPTAIGPDDVIGALPLRFPNATTMQPSTDSARAAF